MPAKYNFPAIVEGDTFKRRSITITSDGNPLDLTGATAVMQLKGSLTSKPVHTFEYEILDAAGGVISLVNWDVDVEPYTYIYDFKITLNNGQTLTYMEGKFPIKESVSEWS